MAWAGGGVFALSLVYLVYFYAVVLASPAGDPADRLEHAAVDTALFSVFALHHSLLARSGAKAWLARLVPPAAERTLYVWIASALLVGVCAGWQSLPGVAYEVRGLWSVPLFGVQILGAILTIKSAGVIDPRELAGIRRPYRANRTGDPVRGPDQHLPAHDSPAALRVVGPFRMVRHPIYLGWMLMVFAAPWMTANRLLFASISSAYLVLAIPWEEQSLVASYGDRYRAYQQHVRWRLVPGLW